MHILIIPSWYPENQQNMSGSFFREQALAISTKDNIRIGIISPQTTSLKYILELVKGKKKLGLQSYNDNNVKTLSFKFLNLFPRLPMGIKLLWEIVGITLYREYIKMYGVPDIVYVQSMLYAGCVAVKIKKHYNIPYIVNEHSSAFGRHKLSDTEIRIAKNIAAGAAIRYCVSPFLRNHLIEVLGNKENWKVIPNFLNTEFFDVVEDNILNDNFTFFTAGHLTKNKGHEILLKSFSELIKLFNNVQLIIAGDGEEYNSLIRMTNLLRIQNSVKFLGELNRIELKKNMQQANVVVVSSFYETFSMICIESLALGKPVVATKCGGPEYIITPEVGLLADRNDVESLTKQMISIYQNYSDYDSSYIKEYCKKNFSDNVINDTLLKDLEDLLSNGTNNE